MKLWLLAVILSLSGCSALTPDLINALAKDTASFCFSSDVRGGVGTLLTPGGGYGQGTTSFCRSNQPSAKVTLLPDGSITIEHGVQ